MHDADAKILPTEGVEDGKVVIHPHTKEPYVFFRGKWWLANDAKDEKRVSEDAYNRAMKGI